MPTITTKYNSLIYTINSKPAIKRTTTYQYTTEASFWAAFDEKVEEHGIRNMNAWVKALSIEIADYISIEEYRQMEEEE
jgi:hypothetical protein